MVVLVLSSLYTRGDRVIGMKQFPQRHIADKLETQQGPKPRTVRMLLTTMYTQINYSSMQFPRVMITTRIPK